MMQEIERQKILSYPAFPDLKIDVNPTSRMSNECLHELPSTMDGPFVSATNSHLAYCLVCCLGMIDCLALGK